MELLAQLLDLLNHPTLKAVLLVVGGFLIQRKPEEVTKAKAFLLLLASTVLAIVKALFPDPTMEPVTFSTIMHTDLWSLAATAEKVRPWWQSLIFDAIVPWLLAVGTHSGAKNTVEWVTIEGARLKRR